MSAEPIYDAGAPTIEVRTYRGGHPDELPMHDDENCTIASAPVPDWGTE